MDDRLPEALEWWGKAVGDSDAARILIREKGPTFAIGFHMQQAVEKALKGLLTLNNTRFPRTHDLDVLANMAMTFLPSLSRLIDLRAQLNEFAVVPKADAEVVDQGVFHHVSPVKFLFMSLVTFGVYELYWFYRGWSFLKEREGLNIWPFWRAFFAPLWFFAFASRVYEEEGREPFLWPLLLTGGYLVSSALWRLPEHYWVLSFLTLGFMLPLVLTVNRINRAEKIVARSYRRFGFMHAGVTLIGLPLLVFSFGDVMQLVPSPQVVAGDRVPAWHQKFLREAGHLPEGEDIVYFYSDGFLSFRADGNYFTRERVVSYWKEEGQVSFETALLADVTEITPTYSSSVWEVSVIAITLSDETTFYLLASADEGRDRLFVQSLQRHWESARRGPEARGQG